MNALGLWTSRSGKLIRYDVAHPKWEIYSVTDYRIDLDWGAVYGAEWSFLQDATPYSTVFALGSHVEVFPKGTL